MNNATLRRIILATLESWQKLTDKQKGPDFQKSVDRLESWAKELEKNSNDVSYNI